MVHENKYKPCLAFFDTLLVMIFENKKKKNKKIAAYSKLLRISYISFTIVLWPLTSLFHVIAYKFEQLPCKSDFNLIAHDARKRTS